MNTAELDTLATQFPTKKGFIRTFVSDSTGNISVQYRTWVPAESKCHAADSLDCNTRGVEFTGSFFVGGVRHHQYAAAGRLAMVPV